MYDTHDFSSSSFRTAILYVDQRTRAIAHWLQSSDQYRFSWDLSPDKAIEVCRSDLVMQLERIGVQVRADLYAGNEADVIDEQLPAIRDCSSRADVDSIRAAFKLPPVGEAWRPRNLFPVGHGKRRGSIAGGRTRERSHSFLH